MMGEVHVLPPSEVPTDEMWNLFVYGTLMTGKGNSSYLGPRSRFLYNSYITDHVMIHMGGCPGVVKSPSGGYRVYGEVHSVPKSTVLTTIDHLEGHPNFYLRTEVELSGQGGGKAWAYILPSSYLHAGKNYIPSGRWFGAETDSYQWNPDAKNGQPLVKANTTEHRVVPFGPRPPVIVPPEPSKPVPAPPPIVGPGWEEAAEEHSTETTSG